ncbi:hypothetical protein HELRODRAFT_193547 [Helobdella robusta]|uniref:adenylate cyclase n=1 Tax=Helobdella robusta TaxID=6412 RepID=T1FV41_HELRO|nr:hypothetical protein HELRODRAFT_193547 [Helobdella robusta]ESN95595.1 hypothetical protein HELRODRAFT_193547 [Helobdella robusta]
MYVSSPFNFFLKASLPEKKVVPILIGSFRDIGPQSFQNLTHTFPPVYHCLATAILAVTIAVLLSLHSYNCNHNNNNNNNNNHVTITWCITRYITSSYVIIFAAVIVMLVLLDAFVNGCHYDYMNESRQRKDGMLRKKSFNKWLLYNMLPKRVARHYFNIFRSGNNLKLTEDLYSEDCSRACVLFATVFNFFDTFYVEDFKEGIECLRVLNEIICDFDELIIENKRFQKYIEKIKTTGSTYMAVSDLRRNDDDDDDDDDDGDVKSSKGSDNNNINNNINNNNNNNNNDGDDDDYVLVMAEFACSILQRLQDFNKHSFNNSQMRIAGVIGMSRPQFDVWGNTVNVASRMESCGVAGRFWMTGEVYNILSRHNYNLTCRGNIEVKGKGQIMTYLLDNRT